MSDARFDLHSVPLSGASSSDATANSPISIRRSWSFAIGNFGPGTVGTASYSATSPRTFFPGPPPPPPFSDGPTSLAPSTTLRNTSQEGAYALDTQAPGFSSSRSVSPLVIPPGGTTQTLTATFTDHDASYTSGMEVLVEDPGAGSSWTFTSSSDPGDTTVVTPGPGPDAQIFLNNPVVGTTYTFTFTGSIPNATTQAFEFKPRVLFQFEGEVIQPTVFASSFSFCDTVLEGGACSSDNVTYTFDDAYELHPRTDKSSLVDYAGGITYAAALSPGYWKNHLTSGTPNTNQYLPQTIGSYTVSTPSQASAIFNAMNCGNTTTGQNAIGCLAGQDLAAELSVANVSDPCINAALTKANAWLSGTTEDGVPGITYTGPTTTYSLTKAQRSEAISLTTPLSKYNAGGGC